MRAFEGRWTPAGALFAVVAVLGMVLPESNCAARTDHRERALTSMADESQASASAPVFQPDRDREIYYDGFERYRSVADMIGGSRYGYLAKGESFIHVSEQAAYAGERGLRFDFQAAGEVERQIEVPFGDWVTENPDTIIVEWQLRNVGTMYDGKLWIADQGRGRLLLHMATSPPYPRQVAATYWQDEWPWRPRDRRNTPPGEWPLPVWNQDDRTPIGPAAYRPNINWNRVNVQEEINDGRWHKMTTRFVRGETYGQGSIEMWWDGSKTHEWIGGDADRPEYGIVYVTRQGVPIVPGFHFPSVSSFKWQGGAFLDYDEVRIWSPGR